MELDLGEKVHFWAMGERSSDWKLSDWEWDCHTLQVRRQDSDLFGSSSKQVLLVGPDKNGVCSISSGSEEDVGRTDLEKRRRYDEVENEEAGGLSLNLGAQVYPITVDKLEKSGKKSKVVSGVPSAQPVCQVDDCKEDLSNAKDYHRRHKVCVVHSKASSALVGDIVQRFCQQCSRFHLLQEFDEGKRSCRKRLAGHNKRRRKTHPENEINAGTLNGERGINYALIHVLRLLLDNQSNSDQTKQYLVHLLETLANNAGKADARNPAELLPVSHCLQDVGTSLTTAVKDPSRAAGPSARVPSPGLSQNGVAKDYGQGGFSHNGSSSQPPVQFQAEASNSIKENTSYDKVGRTVVNNFDLNSVYDGSEDMKDVQDTVTCGDHVNVSSAGPLWLHKVSQQSSPPQNSGNSGSTPSQSTSTSSGDTQSRTERIVIKLFGKDPSDWPVGLREQILAWLSNSPTDMESYIRPGCIILTIYLRMDESTWDELHCNLKSSLGRLLDSSTDTFWRTGWIYIRVRNRVNFIYNGQVVMDAPLPLKDDRCCKISSIKPIAVTVSDTVKFEVKGFNLSHPTSRILCALEGKYLVQENCADMTGTADSFVEHDGIQSLSFSSVLPNVIGRGFIEVEDQGLSSSFFPFIVAEKDVCTEIRTLESIMEVTEVGNGHTDKLECRNQALDFLNEIGWLLHNSHVKLRLGETAGQVDLFAFRRFRWLIEFSIDRDWCAVVKKLLSILVDGTVDSGQYNSVLLALPDIGLLHRAVRRNCRSMVEFLLKYHPRVPLEENSGYYLFRPDSVGPGGLTPIHIAASLDNCDNILDALTDDPGQVGIEAWKNARDSTGLTPHDYACIRGHYSYVHLVQRKLDKKSGNEHIMLDIPTTVPENNSGKAMKFATFNTEANVVRSSRRCGQCEQKLAYGSPQASLSMYRPAMISLVLIAAVCVCAALLFKSSPEVLCSTRPFRWDVLEYGSQ